MPKSRKKAKQQVVGQQRRKGHPHLLQASLLSAGLAGSLGLLAADDMRPDLSGTLWFIVVALVSFGLTSIVRERRALLWTLRLVAFCLAFALWQEKSERADVRVDLLKLIPTSETPGRIAVNLVVTNHGTWFADLRSCSRPDLISTEVVEDESRRAAIEDSAQQGLDDCPVTSRRITAGQKGFYQTLDMAVTPIQLANFEAGRTMHFVTGGVRYTDWFTWWNRDVVRYCKFFDYRGVSFTCKINDNEP